MKRILHIITDTNVGGAGTVLLYFLEAFDREAFHIEVALPAGSQLIPRIAALDVPYTEVPYIADCSFSLKGVGALHNLLRKKRPHLVHTHASFSGRIAAWLCGIPIVHTRHSVFTPAPKSTRFPIKNLLGLVNRVFSKAIIAVSLAAKEILVQTGTKPSHIHVIFNGCPPVATYTDEEKAAVRAQYNIPPETFVVSQVGRLTEVKGHDYTLDAAKILAFHKGILFLLAGDGALMGHLRRRIQEENLTNVQMLGFVENIADITNITDLHLNASYGTEATSMALLECMCLGIPAVVSDFGGNPYVIAEGSSGFVVPQKNAAALAEAVLRLKNDTILYRQMGENAAADYMSRFQSEIMTRNIEDLYKKILQTPIKG